MALSALSFAAISASTTTTSSLPLPSPSPLPFFSSHKCRTPTRTLRAQLPSENKLPSSPSAAAAAQKHDLWQNDAGVVDRRRAELGDDEVLRDLGMEDDIRRLSKKREIEKLLEASSANSSLVSLGKAGVLKDAVDKILVADFFFIILSLMWLIVGLAQKSFLDKSELIDTWLPLWPVLFQPALGVFMAGALFSAISGYFGEK